MSIVKNILMMSFLVIGTSFSLAKKVEVYSLTVKVTELQNSKGVVQFSLYNKEGSIPDEYYKNYYKQSKMTIVSNESTVTFEGLPKGIYAVNILHDEDEDGVIDKGWVLPIEGIGFSNIESINPLNLPSFKKTKFELKTNKIITVKVIYM